MSTVAVPSAAALLVLAVAALLRRSRPSSVRPQARARSEAPEDRLGLRRRAGPPRRDADAEAGEVQALATAIAAGTSVLGAFRALGEGEGPWAEGARAVVAEASAGRSLQGAVDRWADGGSARLVADALAIATHSGGSLRLALASVEATLRERAELDREVRALASQARASALVLVVAPLAFAALLALADARVRAFFLTVPTGPALVLVGLALDAAGGAWMQRAVRRVGAAPAGDRAAQLPELIDLFVVAATAGHAVPGAVDAVAMRAPAAVRPLLGEVVGRRRRGVPLVAALRAFGDEVGPEASPLIESLVRSHETGSPLGPLLESAARTARDRRHRRVQEGARRLPVTLLFPLVACTLPAAVLLAVVPVLLVSLASLSL